MNNFYENRVQNKLSPLLGGCPFLRGSFIGGSTVADNEVTLIASIQSSGD